MKIIKFVTIILLLVGLTGNADAQILKKLKKAVERGVEEGVVNTIERKLNQKSEEKTEEALDAILEGKGKEETMNNDFPDEKFTGLEETQQTSFLMEDSANQVGFQRGSKILYSDDFAPDAVGDFPAKWNTSEGGEVKKLSGFSEKWLRIPANSMVNLEMTKPLPPNFTIEFELIIPADIPIRLVGFALGEKPERMNYTLLRSKSYGFMLYSQENRNYDALNYGIYKTGSAEWKKKEFEVPLNSKIHIAIEVNNHERIRSYVNGIKMTDAPRDFSPALAESFFFQAITHGNKDSKRNYFYVSNVVIAESVIDERSQVMKQLLEEGSFTTNEILFASGSDEISSYSQAILFEIGEAMQTEPDARFQIIGHTDSDGSDDANQKLSQSRATSVKNYLVDGFGINSDNLTVMGKGESEPVADNSTADGKAKNRRVEFKKL